MIVGVAFVAGMMFSGLAGNLFARLLRPRIREIGSETWLYAIRSSKR